MIADPHGPNAAGIGWAEGAITVTKQMTWRFVPGKGGSHLTSDPLGSRIGSDIDRDQPPAGMTQDHQAIEQLERDRANHIQRSNAGGMIVQKGLPTLRWWSPATDHIPTDGRFSD